MEKYNGHAVTLFAVLYYLTIDSEIFPFVTLLSGIIYLLIWAPDVRKNKKQFWGYAIIFTALLSIYISIQRLLG